MESGRPCATCQSFSRLTATHGRCHCPHSPRGGLIIPITVHEPQGHRCHEQAAGDGAADEAPSPW